MHVHETGPAYHVLMDSVSERLMLGVLGGHFPSCVLWKN